MGCTKLGHIHQWPTTGTLVIQRCEVRCNFCEGEAAKKDWKYAWFLRRHVRAIHVKKGQYPRLKVDMGWDERHLRGPGKRIIKKEESSDSEVGERQFIAQPLYEEQQNQGMVYPAFMTPGMTPGTTPGMIPGDFKFEEGSAFDFNDYTPFPALANEESFEGGDVAFDATTFHDFLDDATGGHGMIPEGKRHSDAEFELDADGLPLLDDYQLFARPTPSPLTARQDYGQTAELPWERSPLPMPNPFFMSDYSKSSERTPLSDQPIAKILNNGVHVDEDTRQRILGSLCMTGDHITAEGVDIHQLLGCVYEYAALLINELEHDAKATFDFEGYAIKPSPATLA
ncbi:hypothetical protein PRZ48_000981 [Zasmidium cellare]|uniref:Uncharacterized protein n=1 Tax=Zasmidium cellare TaxID=395010 RepID=A0ABR0F1M4_ZASCE|nr:hypothetical protein PRZ48_000981 [Zasmidium cellare]